MHKVFVISPGQEELDHYYGLLSDDVHPNEQPRHAAFSTPPKKVLDIFNLKADHRSRIDAGRKPKYNYSTRWDASKQATNQIRRQTKYQGFSIENYLKHLLKVSL